MDKLPDYLLQIPPVKWVVVILFALLGTAMQRDMTLAGRLITFSSGFLAAVFFAEPLQGVFGLDASWGHAISAILALTGRNWAAYALRATKDPTGTVREILDIWRGKK